MVNVGINSVKSDTDLLLSQKSSQPQKVLVEIGNVKKEVALLSGNNTHNITNLLNGQNIVFLNDPSKFNSIVESLYLFDFKNITGIDSKKLIENLNNGDTSALISFYQKKIENINQIVVENPNRAFELIQEIENIINIYNCIFSILANSSQNIIIINDLINLIKNSYKDLFHLLETNCKLQSEKDEKFSKKIEYLYTKLKSLYINIALTQGVNINYDTLNTREEIEQLFNQGIIKTKSYINILGNFKIEISEEDEEKIIAMMQIKKFEQYILKGINFTPEEEILYNNVLKTVILNSKINKQIIFNINNFLFNNLMGLKRKNDELENISHIDTLTKIRNRRSLNSYFSALISDLFRNYLNDESVEIKGNKKRYYIFLDIDNFKIFNDNYGHETGDEILYHVAQTIKNIKREGDMLFRYGGEEFSIITHEIDEKGVKEFAEKIRNTIENNSFTDKKGNKYNITISIGVSEITVRNAKYRLIINQNSNTGYSQKIENSPNLNILQITQDEFDAIIYKLLEKGVIEKSIVEEKKESGNIIAYINEILIGLKIQRKADEVLYKAKSNGRNRCEFNLE